MSVGVGVADIPPERWGWLSLATGVAVVDAVAPLLARPTSRPASNGPTTCWSMAPNSRASWPKSRGPSVVIGIGLNVTQVPDDVAGATSLLGSGWRRPTGRLVRALLRELGAGSPPGGNPRSRSPTLAADYRARSLTIGSRVRAQLPGGREVVGTATGVDDQGRLCLQTDSETRHHLGR